MNDHPPIFRHLHLWPVTGSTYGATCRHCKHYWQWYTMQASSTIASLPGIAHLLPSHIQVLTLNMLLLLMLIQGDFCIRILTFYIVADGCLVDWKYFSWKYWKCISVIKYSLLWCHGYELLQLLLPLPFYGPSSGTTRMSCYQKKHSPTHTYPDHQSSFICFLHLLRSMSWPWNASEMCYDCMMTENKARHIAQQLMPDEDLQFR